MLKGIIKKRVIAKESIRDNTKWFVIGITLALIVACFLIKKSIGIALLLLGVIALLVWRLFFGKFRVSDGEVILLFGLPGSGKTMFLAKAAHDNIKDRMIGCNEEISHFKEKDFLYGRQDLGLWDFGFNEHSLLLFDEASLNGFDNRDFKTNFEDEKMLSFFKKIRQHDSAIVFANQGWNELDKKIREGLTNRVYYCVNKGLYSVAYLMIPEITINDITGEIQQGYRYPEFTERIADPSTQMYVWHRWWGKLFNTKNPPSLPIYPYLFEMDQIDDE